MQFLLGKGIKQEHKYRHRAMLSDTLMFVDNLHQNITTIGVMSEAVTPIVDLQNLWFQFNPHPSPHLMHKKNAD